MSAPGRRVHTVRLRAPSDALVRRGATLLEDALRTASLPLPGRVLLVRSLALGAIRPGGSPSSLSLRIEERLARVASLAVHASDSSAASAPAVYFHDAVEPYVLLAMRIAGRESTDAWFWRIATRHWTPAMPRDEALRTVIFGVLETPAGPAAAAALVGELVARGTVDELLRALRKQDGEALLEASGWGDVLRTDMPLRGRRSDRRADAAPAVLRRRVASWGVRDARSAWLAAALLVAERPTLVAAGDLPARVGALLGRATTASGAADERGPSPPAGVGRTRTRTDGSVHDPQNRHPPRATTATSDAATPPAGDASGPPSTPPAGQRVTPSSRGEARSFRVRRAAESPERARGAGEHVPARATETAREAHSQTVMTSRDARQTSTIGSAEPPTAAGTAQQGAVPLGPSVAHRSGARGDAVSSNNARSQASALTVDGVPGDDTRRRGPRFPDGDLETRYAGLFFLVPAMMRLGMGDFLAMHPQLAAADFASRLLADIARRLAVPADDPVFVALRSTPADDDATEWPGEFVVPSSWRDTVAAAGPWTVRRAGDGRALTDGSRNLTLALWHRRAPADARVLCAGVPLSRAGPLSDASPADRLLLSWTTAIRRWCHEYAGIGLRPIVARSGRLSITRTHLDVIFGVQRVDIRVRRAGLDINPHWLPWLGYVVRFRYEATGPRDA